MAEVWKKVWYQNPESLWPEAKRGVWCHVDISNGKTVVVCKEYAELRRAGKIPALQDYLNEQYIDWDRTPEPEENEFGPVTP